MCLCDMDKLICKYNETKAQHIALYSTFGIQYMFPPFWEKGSRPYYDFNGLDVSLKGFFS